MQVKKLPEGWQIIKFGDIAKHISKRVEPSKTDLDIYVGLEHLEPGSLKIKRHGVPSDVDGQKLLVKKGQIIFGKRRAYQRKVAVADWDCICSAHAMVLEAIPDKVIPEFLPFFMQSDIFMNRAVEISEGSLSPTIKWKILAEQTFKFPDKTIQEELLVLFKKSRETEILSFDLKKSSLNLYQHTREQILQKLTKLKPIILGDIGYTYNGLQGKVAKDFDGGNASFIPYMNIFSSRKVKLDELGQVSVLENETQHLVQTGDIFFTVSSETPDEVGMSAVLIDDYEKKPLYLNSFCVGYRPNLEIVSPRFLSHYLRSDFFRKELRKLAQGITRYNISRVELMKCPIYLPKLSKQIEIANILDELDDLSNLIEINYEMNKQLNRILLSSKIGD